MSGAKYHSALEYHFAFDGINHVFADTRHGKKHAEHDSIENSGCYCEAQIFY